MPTPSVATLSQLDPLSALPADRLSELASFFVMEPMHAGADVLPLLLTSGRSTFLIAGSLRIGYDGGEAGLLQAGTASARRAVGKGRRPVRAEALTPCELIVIDDDLIDIMVTWNQIEELGHLTASPPPVPAPTPTTRTGWNQFVGVFSLDTLTSGVFASLPPAHIAELLQRFEPVDVVREEVVVQEGEPGDFYYVIESGRARVTRLVGGVSMPLADLKSGDAFGEEALLVQGRRNATVTMRTDGRVLRLAKADFDELLRQPLLSEIDYPAAVRKVAGGAQWIDVRFPSEYQHDRIPGAVNMPLGELRHALDVLDPEVEYVTYCQSGRRSAAAAFLLAQRGYRASVLSGGIWSVQSER